MASNGLRVRVVVLGVLLMIRLSQPKIEGANMARLGLGMKRRPSSEIAWNIRVLFRPCPREMQR